MHDERLQNAEAQVVARRGVCWFVGLLRVFLLAQFCWQRGVLQMWCSEESGTVAFSQEKRQEVAGISWSWTQAALLRGGPQSGGFEICSGHGCGFDNSPGFLRSAQQGEIKQRLNELDKIISKLEDVGDPRVGGSGCGPEGGEGDASRTSSRIQADVAASQMGPGCTGQGWRGGGGVATASGREGAGLAGGDVGTRGGSARRGYVGCQIAARADAASSWRNETRVTGRGLARDAGSSGGLADPASDMGVSAGSLRATLGLVDPRSDPKVHSKVAEKQLPTELLDEWTS